MPSTVPKLDRITPYLIDLHWLPVEFRVKFKVLLFVYKALNGMAPRYTQILLGKSRLLEALCDLTILRC